MPAVEFIEDGIVKVRLPSGCVITRGKVRVRQGTKEPNEPWKAWTKPNGDTVCFDPDGVEHLLSSAEEIKNLGFKTTRKEKKDIRKGKGGPKLVPLKIALPEDPLGFGSIFKGLVEGIPQCGACEATMKEMNRIKTVEEFEERREEFKSRVRENAENKGWIERLQNAGAYFKLFAHNASMSIDGMIDKLFNKMLAIYEEGYPVNESIILITSFNPKGRFDRQTHCVSRWKKLGCKVIAVQNPQEMQECKRQFPFIDEWAVSTRGKKTVAIADMVHAAQGRRAMLINSDIEIRQSMEKLQETWFPYPANVDAMICGFRWNHIPEGMRAEEEQWGIDVFSIPAGFESKYTDHGWEVGVPMWDWDFPWQAKQAGVPIRSVRGCALLHETHQKGWGESDVDASHKKFFDIYGVSAMHSIRTIREARNNDTITL